MKYEYIDIHCHPNLGELKNGQDEVIANMRKRGVAGIVVGVDLESSREAVRLAVEHEHLWATVGLHPNYTQGEKLDISSFSGLLKQPKVVGMGECGIDYFRGQQANERAHTLAIPPQPKEAGSAYFRQSTTQVGEEAEEGWKEKQWEVFKQQVELAIKHDKPLMIHCRPSKGTMDAYEDVASYLETIMGDVRRPPLLWGNMHFFVGNVEMAKRFWALGFTTSFTGVLTFTHDYDNVVREAPLDMILTETDAPYAAPVPHRGEVNQPAYVRYVAEKIAELKGEPLERVQEAVLKNAKRVFGLSFEPNIAE